MSINSVKRVESFLRKMSESNDTLTFVVVGNPEKIAGLIRQGIVASSKHGFSQYSKLLHKYKIRAQRTKIICELRDNIITPAFEQVQQLIVSGPSTIESILTVLIKNDLPSSVQFTNFIQANDVDSEEYKAFVEWCTSNKYNIMLFGYQLTLTKYQKE